MAGTQKEIERFFFRYQFQQCRSENGSKKELDLKVTQFTQHKNKNGP